MRRLRRLLVRNTRIIRNAAIDLRYGRLLGGKVETRYKHLGAVATENSDYAALPHIFGDRIKATDVLVDVGCGKGRVINWWLGEGLGNRIIGLELDEEIADRTRHRLRRHENVTIIGGNALDNIPQDGTLFYLYNPFAEHVMEAFKDRLLSLFSQHGDITILYYHCKHVHVFQWDPAWVVEVTDVGGPSAYPFDQLAVIRMRRSEAHATARTTAAS
jgi:SAM-dependent methyltransferase